jgi:hypothetical protein
MTEPDMRVLLAELADSVEAPDLATTAWERSARKRRRRMITGAGFVAAAVTIVAGATYLRSSETSVGPANPSPSTPQVSEPGVVLDGFAVAVAPTIPEESTLAAADSPLPAVIDLSAPNPFVLDEPLPAAVAAFGIDKVVGESARFDGVMLVGANGELRHLDAPRLRPIDTGDGPVSDPFTAGSLSPDGTRIAFPQPDGVAVFAISTGEWSSYEISLTGSDLADLHWTSDATIRLGLTTLNPDTGNTTSDRVGSPLYQTGLKVQSWWGAERTLGDLHARAASYLDERAPAPGVDTYPPAIVAEGGGMRALLLIPDQQPRWKRCCSAASWLDADTLAYDSTSRLSTANPSQITRVLAWDVATGEVRLVATVVGSVDMLFRGSYADLSR